MQLVKADSIPVIHQIVEDRVILIMRMTGTAFILVPLMCYIDIPTDAPLSL